MDFDATMNHTRCSSFLQQKNDTKHVRGVLIWTKIVNQLEWIERDLAGAWPINVVFIWLIKHKINYVH